MAKPATDKRTGPRKPPTQARSRARVENILKAAGALLGEAGYDGLSTNLIAERAAVPVGSIYQFFQGKDDIVAALVEAGIDHEYMLFPDEGHGFAKPDNRMVFYTAAEKFLARHLGGRAED